MRTLRFNLLSLLRFAARGMFRRGWLVVLAMAAWGMIDQPLYQLGGPNFMVTAFVARRALAAVAMAIMVAAILDGGRPGQGSLPATLRGLVRAIPTVLLAEILLWGPILAMQWLLKLELVSPAPLMVALVALILLAATLTIPLLVPAAVDGGRLPIAALRTNLKILGRRRWLMLGLALLLLVAMVAVGAATEAGLELLGIEWGRPMAAFYLVFALAAVMQAAAYLELARVTAGGEPERVASAFD